MWYKTRCRTNCIHRHKPGAANLTHPSLLYSTPGCTHAAGLPVVQDLLAQELGLGHITKLMNRLDVKLR